MEAVVNRGDLIGSINSMIKAGVELMGKSKLDATDHTKVKVMRNTSSYVNAMVALVQQESAQQRIDLIKLRMKQLGYESNKELTG